MLKRLLTLFCLTLFFTGCGQKPLTPLGYGDTILAFGDSLTAGYGTTKDKAYPAVLAELTGRNVINAGISGETTTGGLKRFADTLEQHSPALVILLEGGNDILRNHNIQTTKQNLSQMIEMANARNIQLVLLDVPEKNFFSDGSNIYQKLAAEHQVILIEGLVADLLRSPGLKSDPIHLNAKGYRKMAEKINATLKKNGAL